MKLRSYVLVFLIIFSLTSCSQATISNSYYSRINQKKSFTINLDIKKNNQNLTIDNMTFDLSNINELSYEFQKIEKDSQLNKDFIENLNQKIINKLHNIGFSEEIDYNHNQKTKYNNLLFTKESKYSTPDTKTILLTTNYFNTNNEFNTKNISILIEILKLFEYFENQYHLSVLFINNSLDLNNSIDLTINDILYLNISSIIDMQFENILNKTTLLSNNINSKLSLFLEDSIKNKSVNYINISEIMNKDNFKNISSNNIDFVRIISETNTNDLNKSSNFIISILSDILNKPLTPIISINDSIIRINLTLENHDTLKKVLYKIDDQEYSEIKPNTIISFNDSANFKIKSVDLFNNESKEVWIKLF